MHDPQHKLDQAEEKRREGLSRTAERVVAGLVGIGSGLAGLVASTHSSFREKLHEFALFKPNFEAHANKIKEIFDSRVCPPDGTAAIGLKDYLTQTRAAKVDFERHLARKVETRIGIASSFHNEAQKFDLGKSWNTLTKGTAERLTMLGGRRDAVIFKTIVATTIGFAGTMMFFNSLHTRHTLDTLDDKVDALGDKLNAHAGGKGR